MIFDRIANSARYASLGDVGRVLDMIRSGRLDDLPVGRHDLDGSRIYALVQEYTTKDPATAVWEAHRKYIDVQWLKGGAELMGWASVGTLRTRTPYSAEQDVELFDGNGSYLSMAEGDFAVFWPEDAHQPCLALPVGPAKVQKVVVKVAV